MPVQPSGRQPIQRAKDAAVIFEIIAHEDVDELSDRIVAFFQQVPVNQRDKVGLAVFANKMAANEQALPRAEQDLRDRKDAVLQNVAARIVGLYHLQIDTGAWADIDVSPDERAKRGHVPFTWLRSKAHLAAVDLSDRLDTEKGVFFRTSDSDVSYDEEKHKIVSDSLKVYNRIESVPKVIFGPYRFKQPANGFWDDMDNTGVQNENARRTKGAAIVEGINTYESRVRRKLYDIHPLFIYYPEPSSYITDTVFAQANIMAGFNQSNATGRGGKEGARLVRAIAGGESGAEELKKVFKYNPYLSTETDDGGRFANISQRFETDLNTRNNAGTCRANLAETVRNLDQSHFKENRISDNASSHGLTANLIQDEIGQAEDVVEEVRAEFATKAQEEISD